MAEIAGVFSCWSHPIPGAGGEVLGAMALYAMEPNSPSRDHMDGMGIAAKMVGLAVERYHLEQRLLQSAKMEALGGSSGGGIAHDFNNMLAAVLGNAELAIEGLSESDPVRSMLQRIATTSVNVAELCSQMLAHAGRGAMSPVTLNCNELVQDIGGLLQVALAKKAKLCFDLVE
ncbi:MAG: GAF domain-containing protein [Planctomycetota bacterium]